MAVGFLGFEVLIMKRMPGFLLLMVLMTAVLCGCRAPWDITVQEVPLGETLPKPLTGGDKQVKDAPSLYFAADEERLYLLLYGGGIASTGIDGTDEKIIVESDAFQFQYADGWIYY